MTDETVTVFSVEALEQAQQQALRDVRSFEEERARISERLGQIEAVVELLPVGSERDAAMAEATRLRTSLRRLEGEIQRGERVVEGVKMHLKQARLRQMAEGAEAAREEIKALGLKMAGLLRRALEAHDELVEVLSEVQEVGGAMLSASGRIAAAAPLLAPGKPVVSVARRFRMHPTLETLRSGAARTWLVELSASYGGGEGG